MTEKRFKEDITIDISKLRPFNCKYFQYKTLLSKSNCIGYCKQSELKYCKGLECNDYEVKE